MKQYFYKAKLIILIYTMVAILFSLVGTATVRHVFNKEKRFNELSDYYTVGLISQNDEDKKVLSINGLIKIFSDYCNNDFIFAREVLGVNGRAIYASNDNLFQLKLLSGRNFNKSDYERGTNTVIISDNILKKCKNENGHIWYQYGSKTYEVIGVFKGNKYQYVDTVNCYFNLAAANGENDIFLGQFIFDSKASSMNDLRIVKKEIIKKYPDIVIDYASFNSDEYSNFTNILDNFDAMLSLLILTAILVIVNSFASCRNWLNGKKKEIAVRLMIGSNINQIYIWLIKSYLSLVAISFCIGLSLTFLFFAIYPMLPVASSVNLMFGEKLAWQGIIIGIALTLVTGLSIIVINVKNYTKREIIEIVR